MASGKWQVTTQGQEAEVRSQESEETASGAALPVTLPRRAVGPALRDYSGARNHPQTARSAAGATCHHRSAIKTLLFLSQSPTFETKYEYDPLKNFSTLE